MDETPLQKMIREDRVFNSEQARKLEEYWARMGHIVKYQVIFDPVFHVHSIKTDDLGPNGLPKGQLSSILQRNLLHLR